MSSNPSSTLVQKYTTINEVADILSGIHGRILNLHRCSSDDFLALNTDFKRFFQKSKQIADNANTIFHLLSGANEDQLIADQRNIYKEIKQAQACFAKRSDQTIALCKELYKCLDGLFLPVKNLSQDLMTLKFLLANLNLPNHSLTSQLPSIESINSSIGEFKANLASNESILDSLKHTIETTLESIQASSSSTSRNFETIANHLHLAIIFFAETHQEVTLQLPNLTEKVDGTSASLNQIITNLQYHDIIRQKIEHIQSSQEGLIASISGINQESTDGLDQIIVKVRDVANLHAAQLVSANKEYQRAIEKITTEFLSIENGLSNIATLCRTINTTQEDDNEIHLSRIVSNLAKSSQMISSLFDSDLLIFNQSNTLMDRVNVSMGEVKQFHGVLLNIKNSMNQMLVTIGATKTNDPAIERSLSQIQNLFDDISQFEGAIQHGIARANQLATEFSLLTNEKPSPNCGSTPVKLSQKLSSILDLLKEKNSAVKQLLGRSLEMSSEITSEVRSSIHNIKYYDFFDKEIVEIINELKEISSKLLLLVGESQDPAQLESVRELYTMSSEHSIHNQVIHKNYSDNIDSIHEDEGKEDEDNIEFF